MMPEMVLLIGGEQVASAFVSVAKEYRFENLTGNRQDFSIRFTGDFYDPNLGDVNLHVDLVTFTFGSGPAGSSLTWDANTEVDLAGYRIYAGLASRTYNLLADVGLSTSYDLTFDDGKTRYFVATAYDTAGNESEYSNEVIWTAPGQQDTTPPPVIDSTLVNWPDNKPLKMRIVYQRRDATGKPLLPAIRLQMQKFDSLNTYDWLDKFPGADYTLTDVDDSTAVIEMNTAVLKAGIPQTDGRYIWSVRFRIRLENPADPSKATEWVYSDKAIQLIATVNPLEGVPILPTFKIILE
jgi:hypothetical protein